MTKQDQFKGKLSFEYREEEALSLGCDAVLDIMAQFGYDLSNLAADADQECCPHQAAFDCDQYRIDLRYRRHPSKTIDVTHADASLSAVDLRSSLTIALVPHVVDPRDAELNEVILALVMQRIVQDLEPAAVNWLHHPVDYSGASFLSAFASDDAAQATENDGQLAEAIVAETAMAEPKTTPAEPIDQIADAPMADMILANPSPAVSAPSDTSLLDIVLAEVAELTPVTASQIANEQVGELNAVKDGEQDAGSNGGPNTIPMPDPISVAMPDMINPNTLGGGSYAAGPVLEVDSLTMAQPPRAADQNLGLGQRMAGDTALAEIQDETQVEAMAQPAEGQNPEAQSRDVQPKRIRGRACFQPIEETAAELSRHCDEILQKKTANRQAIEASERARARASQVLRQTHPTHGLTRLLSRLTGLSSRMKTHHDARQMVPQASNSLRRSLYILAGAGLFITLQSTAATAF
ncbi:hypothetical protein [Phaeobacter sp.]|uniref:hypothetical protein n=1 Tax=Phaeobacter sp. TaxID=1902409 RepID=UPI0025D8B45D|nr:hypothetical protein [Phaeobacter sp.]